MSSYRAIIRRTDTGGQRMFAVQVEGRSEGQLGGRKTLTLTITSLANANYALGACCEAAITMRGAARVWMDTRVSGFDQVPPGWDEVCPEPGDDKPGMLMRDTTKLAVGDEVWDQVDEPDYAKHLHYKGDDDSDVVGVPPVAEDASIDDATFDQMGDLTWDELKGLADHTIDGSVSEQNLGGEIYPRYSATTTPISSRTRDRLRPIGVGAPSTGPSQARPWRRKPAAAWGGPISCRVGRSGSCSSRLRCAHWIFETGNWILMVDD